MVVVIAEIQLVEGTRDAFLAEFHKIVPLVCEEAGCIEYGPTADAVTSIAAQIPHRNDVITVVEKWESLQTLEAHLVAPHMLEYRPKVKSLVQSSILRILEPA